MRAVHVVRLDGPEALEVQEVPEPPSDDSNVVVEVRAAGVTFPDVLLTRGLYQLRPELPFSPGSEIAGIVRSAPHGADVSSGDRVAAFPGIGGFRDVVAVDPSLVFPLPESTSFVAAAGLPMNYLTVHFGLTRRGRLRAGETVLVHGAAGGVGTAAVQLASVLGARVIAVASSDDKRELAKRAGADAAVPAEGFREHVRELTDGRGVDMVVDPVGGDRFVDSLRCLAPEGRLLVIGFTAGDIPTVKVNRLLLNNLDVVGVGWGAFALPRPGFLRQQWDELLPHIQSGALSAVLGGTYRLEQVPDALTALETRRAVGKLVVDFVL